MLTGMRSGAWVVVLCVTIGGIAGCSSLPWSEHDAQLYSPVNGRVGEGHAGMAPNALLSLGDIPLCVDVPGSVTITGVEPVAPSNGFSVTAFAVREIPAGDEPPGNGLGGLSSLDLTPTQQARRAVTNVCDEQSRANVGLDGPPPAGTETRRVDLVITTTAPRLPASARELLIHYTDASGDQRTTTSAVSLALCAGTITDACDPPP